MEDSEPRRSRQDDQAGPVNGRDFVAAVVVRIDEDVEEVVQLQIFGVELVCFASVCPFPISKGGRYAVKLSIFTADDLQVKEASSGETEGLFQRGTSLAHIIVGRLHGARLSAGALDIRDEEFLTEFSYLDGALVKVDADRIDVEFVRPIL